MIAMVLLVCLGGSQLSTTYIKRIEAERKWLFKVTNELEDSGYFDFGEASPVGVFFPVGQSSPLYYLSLEVADQQKDCRFWVTRWDRKAGKAEKTWQVKLLPGKQPVKGTLLRAAADQSIRYSSSRFDEKAKKRVEIDINIDGFHPDHSSSEWKRAKEAMEARQTFVHYHFSWHGDPSLGHYVDLHTDMNVQFGNEEWENGSFAMPKAEVGWIKKF